MAFLAFLGVKWRRAQNNQFQYKRIAFLLAGLANPGLPAFWEA